MSINYDGKFYDRRFLSYDYDLPFWKEQAAKWGSPILELACGTGRVSLELARQGYQVVGLDQAEEMLKEAQKKANEQNLKLEFKKGDMRNFCLEQKFPLIILPFNSLAHLHSYHDLEQLLSCVGQHLNENGRFVFDYLNPSLSILGRDPQKWYPSGEFYDSRGEKVIIQERCSYDSAFQINKITMKYNFPDGEVVEDILYMRMFFPRELEALLEYNGWVIEKRLGDFNGEEFSSDTPRQIITCRRKT